MTIYVPDSQYQVILGVQPQSQQDANALNLLSVRSQSTTNTPSDTADASSLTTPSSQLIPLNAVATLSRTTGPLTIGYSGQLSAVTLSFNLKPGVSLGDVTSNIEQTARQILPETISTAFQGSAQAFQSSLQGLGLLLSAILVIYLVLGILYENLCIH